MPDENSNPFVMESTEKEVAPTTPKKEEQVSESVRISKLSDGEARTELSERNANLSEQRRIIKEREATIKSRDDEIATLKKAPPPSPAAPEKEVKLPYPDVKRSKDLSKDELEEMSETEKRQMDAIADLQENANNTALKAAENAATAKEESAKAKETADAEKEKSTTLDKFNKAIQEAAMEMSDSDIAKANEIIEAAKLLNLEGKTAADVGDFIRAHAAKLLPDYVPQKEQETATAKAAASSKENTSKVDKIVSELADNSDGNYEL